MHVYRVKHLNGKTRYVYTTIEAYSIEDCDQNEQDLSEYTEIDELKVPSDFKTEEFVHFLNTWDISPNLTYREAFLLREASGIPEFIIPLGYKSEWKTFVPVSAFRVLDKSNKCKTFTLSRYEDYTIEKHGDAPGRYKGFPLFRN